MANLKVLAGFHRTSVVLTVAALCVGGALGSVSAETARGDRAEADRRRLIDPVALTDEERDWIARHPRVRAYFEPWPPFLLEEDGREAGIAVEYLELICEEVGLEIEWVHMGWSAALEAVRERRDVDVLPILTHNREREEYIDFTEEYVSFPIVIFTRQQGPFVGSLDDLRGRPIAVERDYAMHSRLLHRRPDEPLVVVGTTEEALEAVATGRADAYVGHLAVASYLIQRRGFTNLEVACSSPFGTHDQAMGVRRDWPVLAQILDRGLAAITPVGHAEIRQRWLTVRYEHGISPADIALWILGVLGAAGLLLGVILWWNRRLAREIDEHRRAEEALERSQAQLLEAQRISRIGSWTWDPKTNAIEWSPETYRLFERDEALGPPSYEEVARAVHPDDRDAFAGLLRSAHGRGGRAEAELRIRRKDGQLRHLICRGERAPASRARRGAPLVVGTFQDVTERKVLSEERRRMREHLREAQKLESLGILTGGIAHDFNNILASIMGNAELAREETAADSEAGRCLTEVIDASQRAAQICQQMLAYAGKVALSMERVDLSRLIEASRQMLEVSVSRKAALGFELDPELPAIRGDPVQLQQVIMNLAVNSSEALDDGSGSITITTRRRGAEAGALRGLHGADDLGEGDLVVVEVRDDGRGMDRETCRRVFEPFFTTKFAGRGLGMAAVLGIVRSHRGAIRVRSSLGAGTTVTLYFPALTDEGLGGDEVGDAEAPRTAARSDRGRLVLVVDDEPQIRRTLRQTLERYGFEVLTAQDGREAISTFRARSAEVACVVCDLIMPQVDGKETLREMRMIAEGVPMVLMSGYDEAEILRRFGSERRPDAFVQKPFELEVLVELIERLTAPRDESTADEEPQEREA